MKNKKIKFFIIGMIFCIFLTGVIGVKMKKKSLTLENIHEQIVIGKTTKEDIQKKFGKPDKESEIKEDILEQEVKFLNAEKGINFELEEKTNYFDTLKEVSFGKQINYEEDFSAYYQYKGNDLGVESVYFFFVGDKVIEIDFGGNEITNKEAAKKDKYLRQIMD